MPDCCPRLIGVFFRRRPGGTGRHVVRALNTDFNAGEPSTSKCPSSHAGERIVVRLRGGLGNQMFQYAWGRYLAEAHGCPLYVDTSWLLDRSKVGQGVVLRDYDLDVFRLSVPHCLPLPLARLLGWLGSERLRERIWRVARRGRVHLCERQIGVEQKWLEKLPRNCALEGLWQSPQYFKPIVERLRQQDFRFRRPLSPASQDLAEELRSATSICVNVRRLDFVNNTFHGTMEPGYYERAANRLLERCGDVRFFVFADELDWAKDNLRLPGKTTFVGKEHDGWKFSGKLQLMSCCRHFIIPNSTFAWWAAWLGKHPEKHVIAPRWWFNPANPKDLYGCPDFDHEAHDLIPAEWERME
ncbi:MAG: alpha-1,2-fucosyltransferase [Puniceicoccaceae bacterium]|nr:MAG: alpha-1,2-fucosyltransferase [Puniceicoccaceae bacterium]